MKEKTPEQKFIAFLRTPALHAHEVGAESKYREAVLRQYRKMRKAEQGPKWWDLHGHIAKEMVWGLGMLIKHNKGYPGEFDRINGKFPKDRTYSKVNEKKWLAIMQEIKEGFQLFVEEGDGKFYEWKDGKVPPMKWIKNPDGSSTMVPTPKEYKLIQNKKKVRKYKRALALFGKYFEHFWD